MNDWQPIATCSDRDRVLWFWIRPKTDDEAYSDTSGRPIIAADVTPRLHIGKFNTWSALMMATHWMAPHGASPPVGASSVAPAEEKELQVQETQEDTRGQTPGDPQDSRTASQPDVVSAPAPNLENRIVEWREQSQQSQRDADMARRVDDGAEAMYLDGRAVAFERCADEAELTLRAPWKENQHAALRDAQAISHRQEHRDADASEGDRDQSRDAEPDRTRQADGLADVPATTDVDAEIVPITASPPEVVRAPAPKGEQLGEGGIAQAVIRGIWTFRRTLTDTEHFALHEYIYAQGGGIDCEICNPNRGHEAAALPRLPRAKK